MKEVDFCTFRDTSEVKRLRQAGAIDTCEV